MKHLNFLSNLLSLSLGSQSSDVSLDRRLTVGSPSGRYSSGLMRLVFILAILLTVGSGNVWGTDPVASATATSGNEYVIAYWTGTKYVALPKITDTSGSTHNGVDVTVNGSGQVTTENPPLWKLTVNPSDATQFYISYKNGDNTYYLYKNGTSGDNQKLKVVTSGQHYWDFTAGTSSNAGKYYIYSMRGTAHTTLQYYSSKWQVRSTDAIYNIILLEPAPAGPTITTSSSMTTFSCNMSTGVPVKQSFSVSGTALTNNVTVTPPSGYEICLTENGTYTSSIELSKGSGTLSSTTIYVKLKDDNAAGSYSGNISCVSSGATTKNVAVSGSTPFKVTWKANGSTVTTTYVTYASGTGTALGTLPTNPDPDDYSCTGKAFYGWYDGVSYSNASVAPSIISASTKITSDKTYNAVFADVSGSTTTYDLITTAAGLVAGEQYVIGHKTSGGSYYYMPNAASNSNPTLSTITTVTGTQITSTVTNAMLWTLRTSDVSGYGYKWESVASSSNFLATATSTGNNIRVGTSSSFSMNSWSISVDATYGWILKSNGTYTSSGNTKTGKYAVIYGDSEWRVYSANSTNAQAGAKFVIFKKSAVATYSNYATSCCTQLGSINGSFFWTPLFEPLSPDNSWLKTHMEQLPYFIGPISYPAPPYIYYVYIP